MWKSRVGEIIGTLGLLGIAVGCVPAHPYSMKDDGEKVIVEVLKPDDVRPHASGGGEKVVPSLVMPVPVAADYVVKKTAPALDEDSVEHTATYSGTKTASKFYVEEKTGSSVQFAGVRVIRSIMDDGKVQPAAILTFFVDTQELPTNGQLQLIGDTAFLHFGKVKVADRRWYVPWTWRWFMDVRDRIDADVNIVIEGHWIDDKDASHREDVADLTLRLRDLKLGDTTNISTVRSEWFPLLPRSKKPKLGTGTYVVKVKVTEYDDYGKNIKEVSDVVSTNRADWINTIKRTFMPSP